MISQAELTTLFNNAKDLYQLHQPLAAKLLDIHLDDKDHVDVAQTYAELLISVLPQFKAYSSYLLNYQTSILLLRELNQFHLGVANFVKLTETCYGIKFEHLIAAPAARMPQYLTIISAIYENLIVEGRLTEEQDKTLSSQIDQLNDMMLAIARKYREETKSGSVLLYQNMLGGASADLVAPGRYVIKAKKLLKLNPSKLNKKPKPRLFVLCNDIFVYGPADSKLSTGKVDFRVSLDASNNVSVREVIDGTLEGYRNAFRINCNTKSFIIVAESPEERNEWIQSIKVAVNNHNNGGMIVTSPSALDAISEDAKLDEATAAQAPVIGTIGKRKLKRLDSFVLNAPAENSENEDSSLSFLQKKVRLTIKKYNEYVLTLAEPVKKTEDPEAEQSEDSEEH
jgi:hypothetical protein